MFQTCFLGANSILLQCDGFFTLMLNGRNRCFVMFCYSFSAVFYSLLLNLKNRCAKLERLSVKDLNISRVLRVLLSYGIFLCSFNG